MQDKEVAIVVVHVQGAASSPAARCGAGPIRADQPLSTRFADERSPTVQASRAGVVSGGAQKHGCMELRATAPDSSIKAL